MGERADRIAAETRRVALNWDKELVIRSVVEANMSDAFVQFASHAGFAGLLRQSVAENFDLVAPYVAGVSGLVDDGSKTPSRLARLEADLGIPLQQLQRSYRVGLREIWCSWQQHVTLQVEPSIRFDVLSVGTQRIIEVLDFIVGRASAGYSEREEELRRSGAQARRRLIEQVLTSDDEVGLQDDFAVLRYDLSAAHLAVMLSGGEDRAVETVADRLGAGVGASGVLVMRMTSDASVIWFSRARSWTEALQDQLATGFVGAGFAAAVSDAEAGIEGFREVYRRVQRVEKVRRSLSPVPQLLHTRDVRLEVLHLHDGVESQQFVALELGTLAQGGWRYSQLRETLLVYLESRNHVEAAAKLGIHEHTVRNRLQRCEQLLGHSVSDRVAEVLVALRIHRVIADPPAERSGPV